MGNTEILNHAQLQLRILQLMEDKLRQEAEIKHITRAFIHSISPIAIVKRSLHGLAGDNQVHVDLAKVGLNIGANLIIDQVLGKQRSIKGFISSIVMELFSTSFINNHAAEIISGVTQTSTSIPKQENINP